MWLIDICRPQILVLSLVNFQSYCPPEIEKKVTKVSKALVRFWYATSLWYATSRVALHEFL